MKQVRQSTYWFNVNKPVVTSIKELAGVMSVSEEEALEKLIALGNQHYSVHNWLVKLRSKILEFMGETLGLQRKTEEVDGKTKFDESESEHYARIDDYIEENDINVEEQYGQQVQELADSVPYDFKATIRGVGAGSKPAKNWLTVVELMVTEGKLEAYAKKFGVKMDDITDSSGEITNEGRNIMGNATKAAVNEQKKIAAQAAMAL